MGLQSYERLSAVYDCHWGEFARNYVPIVLDALRQLGISHARILDVACGTGVLAVELAKLGHSVLGVDLSPKMIEVARTKTAGLPEMSFQVGDMTSLSLTEGFDCVLCTFDALNYLLTPEQVQALFDAVGRALRPEGAFIFDSNTDVHYRAHHQFTCQHELGGQSFQQKLHYDAEQRIATTVFTFSDGAEEAHVQRPHHLDDILPMLAKANINVVRAISGFDGKPYTSESERLICVAERQA